MTTLQQGAGISLPPLPKPYSVASTIKCTVCGAPYEPARALAPMAGAAQWRPSVVPPYACKCGNMTFGGTVSSECLSPAQFTADQMNAHATAAVLADRASRVSVAEPVAPLWIKVTKAGMYWKTEDPDDESWMRIDIPLAAPLAPKAAEPAASPDVAKMVEEAKRLVEQWRDGSSRFSWHRPAADWLSRDLNALIEALGAAATQARSAASEPPSVSVQEVKP